MLSFFIFFLFFFFFLMHMVKLCQQYFYIQGELVLVLVDQESPNLWEKRVTYERVSCQLLDYKKNSSLIILIIIIRMMTVIKMMIYQIRPVCASNMGFVS